MAAHSFRFVFLFPVVVLGSAGCGTGAYEARMSETKARLESAPKFRVSPKQLYGYIPAGQPMPGEAVNLRIPQVFSQAYEEGTSDPQTGQPLTPERLFPAGVKPPGYFRTYEAYGKGEQGLEWPYYFYLAAQRAAQPLDQVAGELRAALAEKLPATPETWEDVELHSLEGTPHTWKKLRVEGEMTFERVNPDRVQEPAQAPGVLELYLTERDGYQVLLGWRAPAELEESTLVGDWVRMSAGTVQVEGGEPAAQHD